MVYGGEPTALLRAGADVIAQHQAFRAQGGVARVKRRAALREVLFAACQPWEVAWESRGQGDFTRLAAPRLREAAGHSTNDAFQAELIAAFGEDPRQRPLLTCTASARRESLLGALTVGV